MAAIVPTASAPLLFPSLAWFQRLADLMNGNRLRQEQLGYVDCVAEFSVLDGNSDATAWSVQVTFEEFSAVDVRLVEAADREHADFVLAARLTTWRDMIESVHAGHVKGDGRPALDQTLNRLTHMGTPMTVTSSDPLRRDLYFRYNQSLQEFINAAGTFPTVFVR